MGNPSIKYSDGTPYNVNITDYSAEVLKQLTPRKMSYTLTDQIDGRYIGLLRVVRSSFFLTPRKRLWKQWRWKRALNTLLTRLQHN